MCKGGLSTCCLTKHRFSSGENEGGRSVLCLICGPTKRAHTPAQGAAHAQALPPLPQSRSLQIPTGRSLLSAPTLRYHDSPWACETQPWASIETAAPRRPGQGNSRFLINQRSQVRTREHSRHLRSAGVQISPVRGCEGARARGCGAARFVPSSRIQSTRLLRQPRWPPGLGRLLEAKAAAHLWGLHLGPRKGSLTRRG